MLYDTPVFLDTGVRLYDYYDFVLPSVVTYPSGNQPILALHSPYPFEMIASLVNVAKAVLSSQADEASKGHQTVAPHRA